MAKGKKKQEAESTGDPVFDLLIAGIEQSHGKGVIFDMSSAAVLEVPKFSYGSFAIDNAAGGGCPRGRIIEIYGPESSGKTTLCLNAIKEAQQDELYVSENRRALFIDAEHALDLEYAKEGIGVDVEKLIIAQPDHGEQALDILEKAIKTGRISVAVVDSVSTLVPLAELQADMGASHVGLQARLMSQALRKLTGICMRTNTTVIFINQIRYKIGVMFGNPETTSGGNALRFYASQRIDIRRIGTVKDSRTGEAIANKTKVKFVKNKVAPPYREAEVDMRFGIGIDLVAETLDLAVEHGFVIKAGAWYSLPDGERLGQGRENTISELREKQELYKSIRTSLRDLFSNPVDNTTEDFDDEDNESFEEP